MTIRNPDPCILKLFKRDPKGLCNRGCKMSLIALGWQTARCIEIDIMLACGRELLCEILRVQAVHKVVMSSSQHVRLSGPIAGYDLVLKH